MLNEVPWGGVRGTIPNYFDKISVNVNANIKTELVS